MTGLTRNIRRHLQTPTSSVALALEYCDRSHFQDYLLDDFALEFHWSREIIS